MAGNWYSGNASDEAGQHRGWFVGHFINPANPPVRSTNALEVKWGVHPAGQQRAEWSTDQQRCTLVLLISGKFRVDFETDSATMQRQGDYVLWGPGIDHSWQAEQDSVVITVRWPSIP